MELTKNQKLFQKAVVEAMDNATFRKEFVANPTQAILELTGESLELTETKEIVIIDHEDASKVYYTLPSKEVLLEDVELTEDQLEAVAGGRQVPKPDIIPPLIER